MDDTDSNAYEDEHHSLPRSALVSYLSSAVRDLTSVTDFLAEPSARLARTIVLASGDQSLHLYCALRSHLDRALDNFYNSIPYVLL